MRLEIQRQKLMFTEEAKNLEDNNKENAVKLEQEINKVINERTALKAEQKSLKTELEMIKKQKKADEGAKIDAQKLMSAAVGLKPAQLQFIHYQIYQMLNKGYKPFQFVQPGYYQY